MIMNTVIILTSNIWSEFLQNNSGTITSGQHDMVMNAVKAHFRPEFLNRLDEIVLFHPRFRHNIRDVVKFQFDRIISRVSARGIKIKIKIKIDDDALDLISSTGYDTIYGARLATSTLHQEACRNTGQSIDTRG